MGLARIDALSSLIRFSSSIRFLCHSSLSLSCSTINRQFGPGVSVIWRSWMRSSKVSFWWCQAYQSASFQSLRGKGPMFDGVFASWTCCCGCCNPWILCCWHICAWPCWVYWTPSIFPPWTSWSISILCPLASSSNFLISIFPPSLILAYTPSIISSAWLICCRSCSFCRSKSRRCVASLSARRRISSLFRNQASIS